MGFHVTPEKAIRFTKYSVALVFSWPPSLLATKAQLAFFNIMWYVSFFSSLVLLLPLLGSIFEYGKEPIILGKTVSLFSAVAQVAIKMAVCRVQQKRFQALFFDLEDFCKRATKEERIVLQRYVDRYKCFHGVYIFWCFITTAFVIAGPLYTPQTFPTHAKYPFPVERQPLKSIIFLHQSLVGFQASAGMAIDAQVALLLRYVSARYELLTILLREVKSDGELNDWIRKHVELLRYTKEVYRSVRILVLATVATTNVAVIFGSLNLVTSQPLPLKALYALVVFSASVELFMYAWPANNLIQMSAKTAVAAYNTNWIEKDVRMQRKIVCIILRSQILEAIRISGILPKLSLSYYTTYLYTSFSYFTAVRIIVENTNVD
ncbi:uncharacterized protein LOC128886498 isoform X1 [Hylaeus anthracinus]|uniref:uncharacterized protein LOC128886498 isoform X1 n=1 Tax=Hylaeus anthracinus TaxID=313031 RepID=UPI0023B8B201|nr:uncharacterized protein LOC128886498 isoform X1 [Hylaeus anthracinus]XP_053997415.1 uncharacterized protein LOC128886498 isoform X1 [Hylaeus anthracinus]XP_053997416.1 uncharacterized protein LOC128886498 isoform X1 [Hylaeus anthracinus]XP_053997417.1 uncharacterized protein LOC128886498 isoform X1 [Hylaeus anthracinus]